MTFANEITRFDSPSEATTELISVTESANYKLDILSDHLVHYRDEAIAQAISDFVRRHRTLLARVLIKDSKPLQGISHPIVALAHRLPSKVQLRVVTEDALPLKASYCLADENLALFDSEADSTGFCAHDRARVRQYRENFEQLWQNQSLPASDLGRLFI